MTNLLKLAERIHNHDILFLNTGGCILQKADKDLIEAALRTHHASSVSPSVESKAWDASKHDEIIKRLMNGIGMPNSLSVYGAFKQFANELHALFEGGKK